MPRLAVLEEFDLITGAVILNDVGKIKDAIYDIGESLIINAGIQTFIERKRNTNWVKMEVRTLDRESDMKDPADNILGIKVYNSANTSRNGNLYKAKNTVVLEGAGTNFSGFRKLERTAIGRYYFWYRVLPGAALEELTYEFSARDEVYYDDSPQLYFVVPSQIVKMNFEMNDIGEAPRINVALQDILYKPQTGIKYVRVDITFKDLDGDMKDPLNNILGVRAYNNASTSRNANFFKDVAGAAACDAIAAGSLAGLVECERSATGLYYFFYRVQQTDALEELIFPFGWQDTVYYEDGGTEWHYEASEVRQNGAVLDNARRTGQDITTEKEITSGDRYTLTDGETLLLQVAADAVSNDATLTIRTELIDTDATEAYEIHNDEVVVSASGTRILRTSMMFSVQFPTGVTNAVLAVYIISDDAGDTSVAIESNVIEVGAS